MVDWANINSGFVMALLTLVYVLATLAIVLITARSNAIAINNQKIQMEIELQRVRPYVVIYFDLRWTDSDMAIAFLVVKNIGLTMAKNINIKIEPEPCYFPLVEGQETKKIPYMLTAPIPNLAPGQELSDSMGFVANLEESTGSLFFKGSVSYINLADERFEETFAVDWESARHAIPLDKVRR